MTRDYTSSNSRRARQEGFDRPHEGRVGRLHTDALQRSVGVRDRRSSSEGTYLEIQPPAKRVSPGCRHSCLRQSRCAVLEIEHQRAISGPRSLSCSTFTPSWPLPRRRSTFALEFGPMTSERLRSRSDRGTDDALVVIDNRAGRRQFSVRVLALEGEIGILEIGGSEFLLNAHVVQTWRGIISAAPET